MPKPLISNKTKRKVTVLLVMVNPLQLKQEIEGDRTHPSHALLVAIPEGNLLLHLFHFALQNHPEMNTMKFADFAKLEAKTIAKSLHI